MISSTKGAEQKDRDNLFSMASGDRTRGDVFKQRGRFRLDTRRTFFYTTGFPGEVVPGERSRSG